MKGISELKALISLGRTRYGAFGVLIVLAFLWFLRISISAPVYRNRINTLIKSATYKEPDDAGYFHILTPADRSDVNICKAILSATLSDYPSPMLYNWRGSSNMMDKIGGALDYLSSLNETHDADLVMIVDGFDVWYQLPPQIMINRYHEVNRKAEARSQDMNDDLIEERFPQTIIIAAQKRCWPGSPNDVNYSAIPESSLPKYIYGPQTDVPSNDPRNEYKRIRQRFLNAGFIIGPVKEMRTLFLRAQEKAEADREVEGKDQNVLANIFGEQEFMRSQSRLQRYYPHNSTHTSSSTSGDPDDSPRNVFHPISGKNYEFGISLDYEASLSIPTVFAEYDLQWTTYTNSTSISAAIEEYNITHPGISTLQPDIAALPPPSLPAPKDHPTLPSPQKPPPGPKPPSTPTSGPASPPPSSNTRPTGTTSNPAASPCGRGCGSNRTRARCWI